jgi:hypothetical protein
MWLRNLKYEMIQTNRGASKQVYYIEETNNVVLLEPLNPLCDWETIVNSISNEPYDYLIDTLNNETGLVVHWTQLEGTTSDYNIHYGLKVEPKELESFYKVKNKLGVGSTQYKYNEVKNGIPQKLDL